MKGKLEKFIDDHSNELDHRTPDPVVLGRIMQQIRLPQTTDSKPMEKKAGIVVSFRAMRWLAAACLALVAGAIVWKVQQKPDAQSGQITKVIRKEKPAAKISQSESASIEQLAQNQTQVRPHQFDAIDEDIAVRKNRVGSQVQKMGAIPIRQVLLAKLENRKSPASRIAALSRMDEADVVSRDVVNVLVKTLNSDPNSNVRLAAMDGLSKFYRESYVRKQLVSSLKKQQDPVVHIALISLLTKMRESAILTELESLVKDDSTMDAVKESAYNGIFELRGS
jgi:hypothetical protein